MPRGLINTEFNKERALWLLEQFGGTDKYLRGFYYPTGLKTLREGRVTPGQEVHIAKKFAVTDPSFFKMEGLPNREEYFSKPVLEAQASRRGLNPYTFRSLMVAKYHREQYIKLCEDVEPLPDFDLQNITIKEAVKRVKDYFEIDGSEDYFELKDKFNAKGILIFCTAQRSQRRFLLNDDIWSVNLNYEKCPIIIMRMRKHSERHLRSERLVRLVAHLLFYQKSVIMDLLAEENDAWVNAFVKEFDALNIYQRYKRYDFLDYYWGCTWFIHGFGYLYCKVGVDAYIDRKITFDYLSETYFRQPKKRELLDLFRYFSMERVKNEDDR